MKVRIKFLPRHEDRDHRRKKKRVAKGCAAASGGIRILVQWIAAPAVIVAAELDGGTISKRRNVDTQTGRLTFDRERPPVTTSIGPPCDKLAVLRYLRYRYPLMSLIPYAANRQLKVGNPIARAEAANTARDFVGPKSIRPHLKIACTVCSALGDRIVDIANIDTVDASPTKFLGIKLRNVVQHR